MIQEGLCMKNNLLAGTFAIVLFAAAGCGREAAHTTTPAGEPPVPAASGTDVPIGDAGGEIHVSLVDHRIEMPATVTAGNNIFHVMNQGAERHNFEIEGNGIEEKLPQDLEAGQTGVLRINLPPGQYRVYCPVGDHAERGMDRQLTVE
jgi:uncharacterized cupredoxin-like copper-binding protein